VHELIRYKLPDEAVPQSIKAQGKNNSPTGTSAGISVCRAVTARETIGDQNGEGDPADWPTDNWFGGVLILEHDST